MQPEPHARQKVEEHHALLRQCREAGIEQAFAEKTGGASSLGLDVLPELTTIVQELSQPVQRTDIPEPSSSRGAAKGWLPESTRRAPSQPVSPTVTQYSDIIALSRLGMGRRGF